MPTTERINVCTECNRPFVPSGRQVTCGVVCAKARQDKQLRELTKKRGEQRVKDRVAKGKKQCSECPKMFEPKRCTQLACSELCAARRLEKAVERQRQRREQAKQEKLLAMDTPEMMHNGGPNPEFAER